MPIGGSGSNDLYCEKSHAGASTYEADKPCELCALIEFYKAIAANVRKEGASKIIRNALQKYELSVKKS